MQPRVLHRHGELARESDQHPLLPDPVWPRPRAVHGEGADHLVTDDERDEERATDARLVEHGLEAGETLVAAEVGDEEEAPAAKGAEREVEQALGELGVVAAQAARGGVDEAVALTQVDRDLGARRQLGDPLHGGLERVREREVGDRLADDADDGLRPAQRERDEMGSPRAAKGDADSSREAREECRVQGLRGVVPFELERARGRLAERHDQAARARGLGLLVPRGCVSPLDRCRDRVGGLVELGRSALEALSGEEGGRRLLLDPPEQAPRRARDLARDAHDVLGELHLVGAGRERLSHRVEGRLAAPGGSERPERVVHLEREADVSRGEPRERPSRGVERRPVQVELERRADGAARSRAPGGRGRCSPRLARRRGGLRRGLAARPSRRRRGAPRRRARPREGVTPRPPQRARPRE